MSQERTPPQTPRTTLWQSLRKAIYGEAARLDEKADTPAPSSPVDPPTIGKRAAKREELWQDIRDALGRRNLRSAVFEFGRTNHKGRGAMDLLAFVAREHSEDILVSRDRFRLRYLDEREAENVRGNKHQEVERWEQDLRLVQMLLDELDLPGQRLSAAQRAWTNIVDLDTSRLRYPELVLHDAVFKYAESFGWARLIEVFSGTHWAAADQLFQNVSNRFTEWAVGETAAFSPNATLRPQEDLDEVAGRIADVLLGADVREIQPLTRPAPDSDDWLIEGTAPEWVSDLKSLPGLLPRPEGIDDKSCLLYTSPSPRDGLLSRMPSSA